jgi:lipopolysaccharide/colanic/teichoic acid biosynthesis glycosyltransferase
VGGGGGHALNRALDVAVAGTGLVIASPAARAGGARGQALRRRAGALPPDPVGKDGRDFELLKLRTMVVGAETKGAGFAVDRGDPRITRVGRFLRRTSSTSCRSSGTSSAAR